MTSNSYKTNGQLFYQTGIEADFSSKRKHKRKWFIDNPIAIVQIRRKLLSVKFFMAS